MATQPTPRTARYRTRRCPGRYSCSTAPPPPCATCTSSRPSTEWPVARSPRPITYPSYLHLVLTATDSVGLTGTTTVNLNPKTVDLSFNTNPSGLQLTVGSTSQTAPFTRTVMLPLTGDNAVARIPCRSPRASTARHTCPPGWTPTAN